MTTLFLTHAPTTAGTHVPVLRLPYAGGPISRFHRRLRAVDAGRWRALAVSARLADRQFERVARSVRPSVRFRFQFAGATTADVIQAEVRAVAVLLRCARK